MGGLDGFVDVPLERRFPVRIPRARGVGAPQPARDVRRPLLLLLHVLVQVQAPVLLVQLGGGEEVVAGGWQADGRITRGAEIVVAEGALLHDDPGREMLVAHACAINDERSECEGRRSPTNDWSGG